MKRTALLLLLGTVGCNFSPLMNRIEVGQEPFVVVVGEGADGQNAEMKQYRSQDQLPTPKKLA